MQENDLRKSSRESVDQDPRRFELKGMADSLLGPNPQSPTVDTGALMQQVERRNIFKENPNVYYMNGESLQRPLDIPTDIRRKRWLFVAIAMVIAAAMCYFLLDGVVNAPARAQEQMQELLSRDISTNPPDMLKMLSRTDKKIKSTLNNTAKKGGYAIMDMTGDGDTSEMTLVKIPAGVSEEEAEEMYEQGLNSLSAIDLVTLLDGGWDLNVDRTSGLNISLHYADFKSSSPSKAIAQAIAAESLNRGKTTESGDDDGFGNEYSSGTIMINGDEYDWTVSSTYLNEVYSVFGLPENSTYVGIRIIKKP